MRGLNAENQGNKNLSYPHCPMKMLEAHHFLSSNIFFPLPQTNQFRFAAFPISPSVSTSFCSVSAHNHRTITRPWILQVAEESSTTTTSAAPPPAEEEGPIELPSSDFSIFASSDSPTFLQTATSVLLTGSVSVFLFRTLRRRAKRAKELKLRSSGAEKSLKEEALESLKALTTSSVDAKAPPSPVQALLGAFGAGVIALILYKFTTTIEASLNRQTIPDNYSVRQITITIRTIINGICYLATFVFGINSVGLFLYSGQLALNSLDGDSTKSGDDTKFDSSVNSPVDDSSINSNTEDPSSDKKK